MQSVDLQFIYPGATQSEKYQSISQARAHTARVLHARRREAQVQRHQKVQRALQQSNSAGNIIVTASPVLKISIPLISALTSHRHDPFSGFARLLTSTDRLLFDYHLYNTIPHQALHCTCSTCTGRNAQPSQHPEICRQQVMINLTYLAQTRIDALDGLLLIACRQIGLARAGAKRLKGRFVCHHDISNGPSAVQDSRIQSQDALNDLRTALEYKSSCYKALQVAMNQSPPNQADLGTEVSIATILMLAHDEIWHGDIETAKLHVSAAKHILGQPTQTSLERPRNFTVVHQLAEMIAAQVASTSESKIVTIRDTSCSEPRHPCNIDEFN